MRKNNMRPFLAGCLALGSLFCGVGFVITAIVSRISDHADRFVFEMPMQSQLFTELVKNGLKANLNSDDQETQLEAVSDLAWAVEVNPQDIPFALRMFNNDLAILSHSSDSEVATAASSLLDRLRGVK